MPFQDWLFDKRVFERNLRKGLVSRADYDRYLSGLPDARENASSEEREPAEKAKKAREKEKEQ
jgi:hypothetical protein